MAWRAALYALLMLPLFRLHFTAEAGTECTAPPQINNTQPFAQERFPSAVGTQLRYKCEKGYKRRAGNSSLIVCEKHEKTAHWTKAEMVCIRDPSLPSQPATSPPPTSVMEMEEKLKSEAHTTPDSSPGTCCTSEADLMTPGMPPMKSTTSVLEYLTTAKEDITPLRRHQPSSDVTEIEDHSSVITAAPQKTLPSRTEQYGISTVKDPRINSDIRWEKHRQMLGGGVSAAVGVITISIIVIFIMRKRRSQQQAPGPHQEHTSTPMLSLPTASITARESSSFLGEHNREYGEDGM